MLLKNAFSSRRIYGARKSMDAWMRLIYIYMCMEREASPRDGTSSARTISHICMGRPHAWPWPLPTHTDLCQLDPVNPLPGLQTGKFVA
jgi:hypothetical protein